MKRPAKAVLGVGAGYELELMGWAAGAGLARLVAARRTVRRARRVVRREFML